MTYAAVAAAVASGISIAALQLADAAGDKYVTARSNFDLARAARFDAFPLFFLGRTFQGRPLTALIRRDSQNGVIRTNYVSFLYGRCKANRDGCTVPLEVQIWPACLRNPNSYELFPSERARLERLSIRGVPALYYGRLGTPRLELSVNRSTVVLFGRSRESVVAAARSLRALGDQSPRGPLPSPISEAQAQDASLAC